VDSIVRTLREAHALEKGRRQAGNWSPGAPSNRKTPLHSADRGKERSRDSSKGDADDRRVPQEVYRKEHLFMDMRNRKMLLVFDDCDDLVERGIEHFQKFLQELMRTTRNVKVLLLISRRDFRVLGYPNPSVELGPLAFTSAILVLMKLCPSPALSWRDTFDGLQRNTTLLQLQPFMPNEVELLANTLHNQSICPLGLRGLLNNEISAQPSREATAIRDTVLKLRGTQIIAPQNQNRIDHAPRTSSSVTSDAYLSAPLLPWQREQEATATAAYDMSWAMPSDSFAYQLPKANSKISDSNNANTNTNANNDTDSRVTANTPNSVAASTLTNVQDLQTNIRPEISQNSSTISSTSSISVQGGNSSSGRNCWAMAHLQYIRDAVKSSIVMKLHRFLVQRGIQCIVEPDGSIANGNDASEVGTSAQERFNEPLPVVVVAILGSQPHNFGNWSYKKALCCCGTLAIQISSDLSIKQAPESLMLISANRRRSSVWMNQLIGEINGLIYSSNKSSSSHDSDSDD
jgi:hypothetical protein